MIIEGIVVVPIAGTIQLALAAGHSIHKRIGLSDIEIATAIAEAIQQCYVPSLDAIC